MRLLVFLHGTVLMHPGAVGLPRDMAVAAVRDGADPSVRDFAAYVPVGLAVERLRRWQEQGASLSYLTSRREPEEVAQDARVLGRHGFPGGRVLARAPGESYGHVAQRCLPDVLIEDDCASIGSDQITYPQISAGFRARIWSIVVPEFGGIDHLPDAVAGLRGWRPA